MSSTLGNFYTHIRFIVLLSLSLFKRVRYVYAIYSMPMSNVRTTPNAKKTPNTCDTHMNFIVFIGRNQHMSTTICLFCTRISTDSF